jgi:hypothetical protein
MRCAAIYKPDSEPLGQFVKRKGGINECVARFSRVVGRRSKQIRPRWYLCRTAFERNRIALDAGKSIPGPCVKRSW